MQDYSPRFSSFSFSVFADQYTVAHLTTQVLESNIAKNKWKSIADTIGSNTDTVMLTTLYIAYRLVVLTAFVAVCVTQAPMFHMVTFLSTFANAFLLFIVMGHHTELTFKSFPIICG